MICKKTMIASLLIASLALPQEASATSKNNLISLGSGLLAVGLVVGVAMYYYFCSSPVKKDEKQPPVTKGTGGKSAVTQETKYSSKSNVSHVKDKAKLLATEAAQKARQLKEKKQKQKETK